MLNSSVKKRKPSTTPRQSNIELLRIFSMIIIIGHHFSVHGGIIFPTNVININRLWVQFIQMGGKIGVDIFIMISGYFLITSEKLKCSKVLRIWLQIFTYSVVTYLLLTASGMVPFSLNELMYSLLPITFSGWWFASGYFVLYLLFPYINTFLKALSIHSYQRFLVLLTVIWCIIPSFLSIPWQCNTLLWFIYLYALAGYIRLYIRSTSITAKKSFMIAGILILLTFLSVVAVDVLATRNPSFATYTDYFYDMQRLPVLLISLFLFLGFSHLNIKYIPAINIISSATFGVYLIHDNYRTRTLLWNTLFKVDTYADSKGLILYSILVIFTIFIVCSCIELLRMYLIERRYLPLLNTISKYIEKAINWFFSLKFFETKQGSAH